MITEHSTEKPDIQGLILLDCWEPQVRDHFFKDKYYINLIEKLKDQHFKIVINSAGRLQIDLKDPSLTGTLAVCQGLWNHPVMTNLLGSAGDEKTSTLISRYLFNEQVIHIVNDDDFLWLATNYLNYQVHNWLVVGLTWQMCTHEHILGLSNLAQITKQYDLNFYATDYSFCTTTERPAILKDFEQDNLDWCLIEDFGYRLLPHSSLDKYEHGNAKSHQFGRGQYPPSQTRNYPPPLRT